MITVTYDFFEKKLRSAEDFVNPSDRKTPEMRSITAGLTALAAVAMWAGLLQSAPAMAGEPLLKTRTTILGQALDYPAGDPAEVTSLIVTLEPGEETVGALAA